MRVTLFKIALKDSASGCPRSTHGAHEGVHRGLSRHTPPGTQALHDEHG
jgi:hypothetical protein